MEEKNYICKICNKFYKNSKSLWKHNYIYHKKNNTQNNIQTIQPPIQVDIQKKCIKCGKILSNYYSKWRHEKKCNKENSKEDEIKEMKKEIEMLKNIIQKSMKIHPKTLNKINNQLINNNNNNNNNINNGNITNNNIYVQLGRENLSEILTEKEKKKILNRQSMGLNDLVDLVHISGKYKQFRNVYITNLQNNIGYRYDDKKCKFIPVSKNELLTDLVDARMYDIENFFEEFGPSLEPQKYDNIKKFIERMNDEEDVLKGIKKNEIKLVIYNPNNPNNSIEI